MPEMQLRKFEPVPKGTYYVRVKDCKYVPAGPKVKDPFYSWGLEILDEGFTGEVLTFAGSPTFSPNTKTYKFLVATGRIEEGLQEAALNTDDYIGAELYVEVDVVPNTNGNAGNKNKIIDTKSIAAVEALAAKLTSRTAPRAAAAPATAPATRPAAAPAARPAAAPATRPAPARPAAPTRVAPMSAAARPAAAPAADAEAEQPTTPADGDFPD